jgi:hypothetical protein
MTAMNTATKKARIVLRTGRGESATAGGSAARASWRSVPALVDCTASSARRSRSARCWAWPLAELASAELAIWLIWRCSSAVARVSDAFSVAARLSRNALATALAMSAAPWAVPSVAVIVMMFALGSSVEVTRPWRS